MLNREEIKGIRERHIKREKVQILCKEDLLAVLMEYRDEIPALLSHVEELEERCKRLEKINDTAIEAGDKVISAGKQMRPRIEELEAKNLELEERLRKAVEALKTECPACSEAQRRIAASGVWAYTEACSKCQACSKALAALSPSSHD